MSTEDIRACALHESEQWAEFLNRNFGYEPGQSYSTDFAPLFVPQALAGSRLFWKDGKIASSATLYPVSALTPAGRLDLGIVGAVATDETYRGQGLSTKLLTEVEKIAQAKSLDAIVLWSDQLEFYGKAGYQPVGSQEIYALSTLPKPAKLASGTAAYGWDWKQVRSSYEAHSSRIERSDEYWKSLEGIRSCTRVQWLDEQGVVKAYLGFDRGKDLNGIIHEWGGEAKALTSLLWVVLHNRPNLLWLTHPNLNDPIRAQLDDTPVVQSHMALTKLLKPGLSIKPFEDLWFWGLDSL